MLDQAQIIKVVIASPSDLELEREAIPKVFIRWNSAHPDVHLLPIMWETTSLPTLGDHPQRILDRQMIEKADLLVALFWTKIGSPTPTAPSGTIEEIREFIRLKGPKRVMLYFCTRPVGQSPDDIDSASFAALREFKAEMRSEGLYHEFKETATFEGDLYFHLDLKTNELLNGLLPIPGSEEDLEEIWWDNDAADERLRNPLEFGSSIADIASRFSSRMDQFDHEGGATVNKFLKLGEHTYRSAARSIDLLLRARPHNVNFRIRPKLAEVVLQLRRLADDWETYASRPFPEFWQKGRVISNALNDLAKRSEVAT